MEQQTEATKAGAVLSRRRPYTGSCHCGATKFIVFLTIPPPPSSSVEQAPSSGGIQRLYRCNCTICHKAGFMHMRPVSVFNDFLLLSPSDPFVELGDYVWNDKVLHFFFCKTCAVRCFIFAGEGEIVDVDLSTLGIPDISSEPGKTTKAWKPKKSDVDVNSARQGSYISINGQTIDAGQEGFDLREFVENKSLSYLDCLREGDKKLPKRYDRPHDGGSY